MGRANLCARGIRAYMPLGMALWRPGNYTVEILRPQVISYTTANRDSSFPMHDNANSCKVRFVENNLKVKTMQRMETPTFSHVLNFIEHIWEIFKWFIAWTLKPFLYCPDLGNCNSWGKWINIFQILSIIAWDPSKSDVFKF